MTATRRIRSTWPPARTRSCASRSSVESPLRPTRPRVCGPTPTRTSRSVGASGSRAVASGALCATPPPSLTRACSTTHRASSTQRRVNTYPASIRSGGQYWIDVGSTLGPCCVDVGSQGARAAPWAPPHGACVSSHGVLGVPRASPRRPLCALGACIDPASTPHRPSIDPVDPASTQHRPAVATDVGSMLGR